MVTAAETITQKKYGFPQPTLTDNNLVFSARLAGAKGGKDSFENSLKNTVSCRKTDAQDTPKPKEKLNASTKH